MRDALKVEPVTNDTPEVMKWYAVLSRVAPAGARGGNLLKASSLKRMVGDGNFLLERGLM